VKPSGTDIVVVVIVVLVVDAVVVEIRVEVLGVSIK
jgi:hypothetical protein